MSFLNEVFTSLNVAMEEKAPDNKMLNVYKRKVKVPDPDLLFPGQRRAFDEMLGFLKAEGGGMHVFQGYAGTGKTFTLSMLIEWVLSQPEEFGKLMVAMTAPTNDAVRVLYEMADYRDDRMCFKTGHSLLGLIAVITDEGLLEFVKNPNPEEPAGIETTNILIVDETSQLSDYIFSLVEDYIRKGLKIIFTGDNYQIPPVGQVYSIPFLPPLREFEGGKVVEATYVDANTKQEVTRQFTFTVSVLDEIVRQGEGSPIIENSIKLRHNIHRPTPLPTLETQLVNDGEEGIKIISNFSVDNTLGELFLDERAKDVSFVKVLAWRNKTVDEMNRKIRKLLFPEGGWKQKIAVGDKLIAKKPILQSETGAILFPNKERFEVVSFEIKERKLTGATLKYYEVVVLSSNFVGRMREETITVIHEDSEETLKELLRGIAQTARKRKDNGDSKGAREMWEIYHNVNNNFAQIGYNYAITCHNAQGKTLEYTVLIWPDLDFNSNVFERNRIKYTAMTRSKKIVYIVR